MPSIVDAQRLSKTFQVKVRDPGLRGALRALLRPRYRDVHAVRDVTFRIDPGEIVAFLGPNGAGKTTTLKMLAGLLYPTSGRVEAAGFVPWTGGPPFKRRIALVLGNRQQLVWDLPPEETFLLNRAIYDIPAGDYRERLAELVTLLELGDVLQKPVRQLSLGERMKCELVASLLHRPPLLFLDEPTLGLDVTAQDAIRRFLIEYRERHGATVLLTSHYMQDVTALASRVLMINRGATAVRRSARGARGADRTHQADRVGARWTGGRGGRRQPGDRRGAGRVRRGEELPLPERGARGATRGRARDQRPPARRSPGGRSVDRGSADRGSDPARVRARRGGRRVIRRYAALIRNAWLVDLQYRASIVLWLLWGVAEPAIALGIWWTIAGDGSVAGYARADFARYFFAVMLINQLTIAWDSWYLDRWIREGDLNYRLARPLHPAHEAVAENIAYKARTASVILVVWLLAAAAWPAVRLPFDPGRWAITAVAVLLAAAMRFFISFTTGLLAFWTTRATAIMELHARVSLFLAGRIAPLALLPPAVASVAGVLWFRSMLAFPVDLLTGAVQGTDAILRGLSGQIVWLAVWILAYRVAWTRGIRKYGAVGG